MKHTLEEKRDIVRQIKRGRPLSSLCKALHLDCHMVRDWLLRYEKYGDQGLRIRTIIRLPHPHMSDKIRLHLIAPVLRRRQILPQRRIRPAKTLYADHRIPPHDSRTMRLYQRHSLTDSHLIATIRRIKHQPLRSKTKQDGRIRMYPDSIPIHSPPANLHDNEN